jgi:hypothetical protein
MRKMRRPPTEAEAKASALKRTASFKRTADAKAKALEEEKQGKKRKPVEVASDPIMDALVNKQLDIINQTKEFRRPIRTIMRKPQFPDYLTEKEYNSFKKFIKAVKESVPELVNNLSSNIMELATIKEGNNFVINRENVDWRKLWATISSELDDWFQGDKMKDWEEAGDAKFVERKLEDLILEHLDDPKKERDPKIEKQIRDGLIDGIGLDMYTDDTDPYDYETTYQQLVSEYVTQYLYDNFGEDLIGRIAVYERRMTQEEYDAGENEYPFQNIMNQTISDYQLERDPENIDDYYVDDFVYPFNNTAYKARGGRAD